ncbi:MAG: hypothetical protein IT557_11975 [Alphaproteobacteria bacterium]|nr:hypothetical protein [Alphaproteobacteria bacterium]
MLANGIRRRLTNLLAGIAVVGVLAAWVNVSLDLLRDPNARDECGFNDPSNLALRLWSEDQYWYTVKQWFNRLGVQDSATSERYARAHNYLDLPPGASQRTMTEREAVSHLQGGAAREMRAVNRRTPVAGECEQLALRRSRDLPASSTNPMPDAIGLRMPNGNEQQR